MTKQANVMVAVPSGSSWNADTVMCMVSMVAHSMGNKAAGYDHVQLSVQNTKGSILPKSRDRLVDAAKEKGATHILFIDSDMTFPVSTLNELLAWDEMVVAANCATKSIPSHPTARNKKEGDMGGELIFTTPDKVEGHVLEQCWRVGCGVMLINMKVFEELEKPYFPIEWNEQYEQYVGEDWGFCHKCEAVGIPLHVDHYLSSGIGHCGQHTYTHEDVLLTHPDVRERYQLDFINNINSYEEEVA